MSRVPRPCKTSCFMSGLIPLGGMGVTTRGREDTVALLCLEAGLVAEVMPKVTGSQD